MIDIAIRQRRGAFALDAAFTAPAAGVVALFGRSGAGKSTLVQAIAGLLRPDAGRIRIGGTVFFDRQAGIDLPPERRRVGYVFQDARLFPHLTVCGNLLYGFRRAPAAERRIRLAPVADLLGIGGLLERRPHDLSGGERQRVALGRALLANPRLLLMDEPMASLDEPRKLEILPYIERLRDEFGLPVIYVSHALAEVVRLAAHMVVLEEGRVAAAGPLEAVLGRIDSAHFAGASELGAVFEARVSAHEPDWALTVLSVPGGELRVPRLAGAVGEALRIRILARDVLIATRPPEGLSAQNVLAARVEEVGGGDAASADVRLSCDGRPLLARVTRRSVARLGLAPGRPVFAVIKTVALAADPRQAQSGP